MPVHYRNLNNPRDERLAAEHRMLDEFCEKSLLVSYEPIRRRGGLPPEGYYFHYNLRSIVGINADQSPIYGDQHTAKITIPEEFPLGGQPECYMTTPVWHPNIKTGGNFAGRICINADALGDWHTIDMLAERIGEMLQFKNYHAIADQPPYPEDAQAALWIRKYAEPRNIVNKERKIFTDDRTLLPLSPEWEAKRAKKIKKITGINIINRRPITGAVSDDKLPPSPPREQRIRITIIKKR